MAASSLGQTEINWDKLDKSKFYVVGAGIFTGLTVGLYPVSVIKTRLQVATRDTVEKSASSVIRGILKTDGVPGLYRGFGTVITGAVPARIIFLTALETTKVTAFKMVEPFNFSEPTQAALANGIAGMAASLCSQAVFVPIDLHSSHSKNEENKRSFQGIDSVQISQKLMVQGYSGHEKYNGGLDVARKIIRTDGIRGFYRGFGLSVMTYSPSSAVWWASYGSSQRIIWRLLGQGTDSEEAAPSKSTIMLVQATGGIIAGATASCITTPLDTIKTRLQVMGHERRSSARQVVKNLIKDDGWTGFYRGLGPRFVSMSAWGTTMILAYEYLSMHSFFSFTFGVILLCENFNIVNFRFWGFKQQYGLQLNGLDESNGFYICYVTVGLYCLDAELECWSGPHSSRAGTFENSETRSWSLGTDVLTLPRNARLGKMSQLDAPQNYFCIIWKTTEISVLAETVASDFLSAKACQRCCSSLKVVFTAVASDLLSPKACQRCCSSLQVLFTAVNMPCICLQKSVVASFHLGELGGNVGLCCNKVLNF
ncbi:solute carrier family 25 member 44 isoform X1 [Populus alba x Populus x berolinensis]|nr:solute carrier family 25 member 44 isoform X1 [Populus alba x Populus x berolinensis]